MGSIGNPKSWAPYLKNKDCSQGFCSLYCPQWCYIIFPPPPSSDFSHVDHHSSSSRPIFSPLVIAIIGILASALLLVSYYSIISKYCGNPNSSSSRRENDYLDGNEESEENNIQNPNLHEPWHVISTGGLDEALIKSITTCKYKKGDGLIIDGSDCSVCLSEFEDDESIRLLPKCSHAFHVHCIDTWLKSHSNCPVCRANIICSTPAPPPLTEISMNIGNNVTVEASMTSEASSNTEIHDDQERENTNLSRTLQDTVIHITDELGYQGMRRSFSMDHFSYQNHVSIADILRMDNQDEEENYCSASSQGSSKHNSTEEISKNRDRKQVVTINRSFSSGRLFLSRQGRVRNTIIPL